MSAGWINQVARGLGEVLFPPTCVHCRSLVEPAGWGEPEQGRMHHLCGRCAALLERVKPPHCRTCGHPFYGEVTSPSQCEKCQGLEPAFGEGRTAVLFKGGARALVIEFKYHRGQHVLEDMAEVFRGADHVLELARGSVLVPVPLHPRKARERGYNQARLLADALARAAGQGTTVRELLRRVVDTRTQTAFDRRSRMANLKNAFALVAGEVLDPEVRHILVDDVFTTGSTLNSCARTLRRAGLLKLDVVTFAHG